MTQIGSIPLEQMLGVMVEKRKVSIGLPAPAPVGDHRFPLTPEAAGLLVERGFNLKMQTGAADAIHYSDLRYQQQGVEIVDRREALRSDIVVSLSPMSANDARGVKRGALLLTLFDSFADDPMPMRLLLEAHVITIALDLVRDDQGHRPFADILAEISGRAAIALAASLLADAEHGKGILLGGIAGIVPCEVTIIGSGIDAVAAARSALGLGAMVRMFDNDVYRLRLALRELGGGVMGSALHPRVLLHALQAADVVIATPVAPALIIGPDSVSEMKSGVIAFDLSKQMKPVFPSLVQVDLGQRSANPGKSQDGRACFTNTCNAVPRTTAMALSNAFLTLMSEIFTCDGLTNALMLNPGLQAAALTFLGKPVNSTVASMLGMRPVDIKLILQFS